MKRTTMTALATLMVVPSLAFAQTAETTAETTDPLKVEQSAQAEVTTEGTEETMETELAEGEQAIEDAADEVNQEMAEGAAAVEGAVDEATTEMAETADEMTDGVTDMARYIRARDMIDGAVYTMVESTDMVWDGELMFDGVDDTWDKVGEIEDIVLASDGSFKGVIAEVGGFLDIGDKHVMLPIDNVKLVPVDDVSYAIVTPYSLEELKSLEDVDEGFWN